MRHRLASLSWQVQQHSFYYILLESNKGQIGGIKTNSGTGHFILYVQEALAQYI